MSQSRCLLVRPGPSSFSTITVAGVPGTAFGSLPMGSTSHRTDPLQAHCPNVPGTRHMLVLVCGSRTFADHQFVWDVLGGLNRPHGITVITGMARGADTAAVNWANANERPLREFPANWKRDGKRAGPIRNQQMLEEGKPDVVLAFTDKPLEESRGTHDMVRRSRKAGIPVYHIRSVQ